MANSVTLILLDDVEKLGLAGEEVRVTPGYARNFLLPRRLAAKATPGILRVLESRKAMIAERRAKDLENSKVLAAKLADVTLTINAQATEQGQLFGSISARTLSEELKKSGFEVSHTKIALNQPIKTTGDFDVEIRLHSEVTATVKVKVVRA